MRRGILIIPAWREAGRIGPVVEAARREGGLDAVVVIDDGSPDETGQEARAAGARVLRHPFNLGYGAALQTGYKYALECRTPLVVQMDADGQHDPRDVPTLVAPIEAGELDLVVGSRFLSEAGYRMGALHSLGRLTFRSLLRLGGLRISDPTSGFQAMNLRVLRIYARDFFPTDYPDVDVLLAAWRHGLRIGERPVTMKPGVRSSRLHGGLRSFYYVYKMLLATWSASGEARRAGADGG